MKESRLKDHLDYVTFQLEEIGRKAGEDTTIPAWVMVETARALATLDHLRADVLPPRYTVTGEDADLASEILGEHSESKTRVM
jgi:hypothetical protein